MDLSDVSRRRLLSTGTVLTSGFIAGCSTSSAGDTETPTPQPISDDETRKRVREETPSPTEASRVSFNINVFNHRTSSSSATLKVTHKMIPACKFDTPECRRPTDSEVRVEEIFSVPPQKTTLFSTGPMESSWAKQKADTFLFDFATTDESVHRHTINHNAAEYIDDEFLGPQYTWLVMPGTTYTVDIVLLQKDVIPRISVA
jgi:hypothetical protein